MGNKPLLEQVEAMLQGIIDAQVTEECKAAWIQHNKVLMQSDAKWSAAGRERDEARAELRSATRDRDILRESVKAWQEAEATARGRWNAVEAERDAARAELAGVAAQRDAHLSRSVELAARVTELEARLAALTPAAVEVDGFRVGDLVRSSALTSGAWGVIESTAPAIKVAYPDRFTSYSRGEVTRKPVEVGDTVRITEGLYEGVQGRVDGIISGEARVVVDPSASLGEARWVMLQRLVAVAP